MSRVAVFEILVNDLYLETVYGLNEDRILPAHSIDSPPRSGYFLVMRWEEESLTKVIRPIQILTIWAHYPREKGRDFKKLQELLERVKQLLTGVVHYEATDGSVMAGATYTGQSEDLVDPAFDTITRNAAFEIRRKVSV